MTGLIEMVQSYGLYAPYLIFFLILLAGCNVPVSIDVLCLVSAFMARTYFPEQIPLFFGAILVGSIISAWIAYWIGRTLGIKLLQLKYFALLFPEKKRDKLSRFYQQNTLRTLLVGRFIPFGVRNCLFLTAGISKASFKKFVLCDLLATTLWASVLFTVFYQMSASLDTLLFYMKEAHIWIFSVFAIAVITTICYKRKKAAS